MFDYKETLPRYIAGGSPSEDTLKHYNTEIENFLAWCTDNAYDPLIDIDEPTAFEYLDYLNKNHFSPASICLKIAAARTFYFVACKLRRADVNPFDAVKPKKPTYDDAEFDYFDVDELKEICDSIIKRNDPTAHRDLAIVMLMSVEGLRTVEIHRMSDEDFNIKNNSILIHGKGRDNYIYPCQDTLNVLETYLNSRPEPVKDEQGTPTFIGFSPKFFGVRISRNGIRWAVNHILLAVDKKKKGSSCHTLRHSCGTNLYAETKDLRLVQETLRQKDPQTTARYAHVKERTTDRQTAAISPLKSLQTPDQHNL